MKGKINLSNRSNFLLICLSLVIWLTAVGSAFAQSNTFTYQGRLTDGSLPANGIYEMQFSIFDAVSGGSQIGTTIANSSVTVTNGVFNVPLDFSPATPFATGADRWLGIAVRKLADPPGFTTLAPRQPITTVPYSTRSMSASTADNATTAITSVTSQNASQLQIDLASGGTINNASNPVDWSKLKNVPADVKDFTASNYIQNATSPQTANIAISGNAVVGGSVSSTPINYVDAYDTTNQGIGNSTWTNITYNTNNVINGWVHAPATSTFICPATGLYLIQYYGRIITSPNGGFPAGYVKVAMRATKNGNEVLGSGASTESSYPGTLNSQAGTSLSKSFIAQINAGDALALQVAAPTSLVGLQLTSTPIFGFGTPLPSSSITIVRVQ